MKIIIAGLTIAFGLLISCSPRLNNTLLNFFFDGVPPPEVKLDEEVYDLTDYTESLPADPVMVASEKGRYYIHQPYKSRYCTACHNENNLGDLITTPNRLCNYCHDDYSDIYPEIHGPVEAGYCMLCHNPHMSEHRSMLINEGDKLCTNCHLSGQLSAEAHNSAMTNNCLTCHNPHGGRPGYLK